MSKGSIYYWAPSSGAGYEDGIALTQSLPLGGGNIYLTLVNNTPGIINDSRFAAVIPVDVPASPGIGGIFSYINTLNPNTTTSTITTDIIRSVNLTSHDGSDNSGVQFGILGIGTPVDANGNPTGIIAPIYEQITGPAADATVTSVNIYTAVYEILIVNNMPALNISAGYGPNGITNYWRYDYNRNTAAVYSASYTLQMIDNATLMAAVYGSMNNPEYPNTMGGLIPFGVINGNSVTFIPAIEFTAPTNTFTYNTLYSSLDVVWAQVDTTTTDSMLFTIVQEGIT
jgi:hypothetical protein